MPDYEGSTNKKKALWITALTVSCTQHISEELLSYLLKSDLCTYRSLIVSVLYNIGYA